MARKELVKSEMLEPEKSICRNRIPTSTATLAGADHRIVVENCSTTCPTFQQCTLSRKCRYDFQSLTLVHCPPSNEYDAMAPLQRPAVYTF